MRGRSLRDCVTWDHGPTCQQRHRGQQREEAEEQHRQRARVRDACGAGIWGCVKSSWMHDRPRASIRSIEPSTPLTHSIRASLHLPCASPHASSAATRSKAAGCNRARSCDSTCRNASSIGSVVDMWMIGSGSVLARLIEVECADADDACSAMYRRQPRQMPCARQAVWEASPLRLNHCLPDDRNRMKGIEMGPNHTRSWPQRAPRRVRGSIYL